MLAVLAARAPRLRELDLSCTPAGAAPAQRLRALCAGLCELQVLRLEGARLGAAAVAELLGLPPPDPSAVDAPGAMQPRAPGWAHGPPALPAYFWGDAAAGGRLVVVPGPLSAAPLPYAARAGNHAELSACGWARPPPSCGRPSDDGPQVSGPMAAAAPALRALVLTGGAAALAGLGIGRAGGAGVTAAGGPRRADLPPQACGWLEREQWRAHGRALGPSAAMLPPGTRIGSFAVRLGPGGSGGSTSAGEDTDGHDPGGLTLYLVDGACPCVQPLRTLPGVAESGDRHFDATTMRPPVFYAPREPVPCQPAALCDLPHLAVFDERLRYSAAELLALRGATAPGARLGRLAALPSELLAGGLR